MELRSRGRRTPLSLIPVQVGTPQCDVPDDATVLAEAQTMYTKLFIGDWLCYYTKERWIGSSNGSYMGFSNHDTALCEAIWLAYQEWQRELEDMHRPPRFASEAAMRRALRTTLEHEGWHCRLEWLTPYGRVYMRAQYGARTARVEFKLASDGNTLKAALGQLLAYGFAESEAELWLALPVALPIRYLALFERYNVTPVEVPCLSPMEQQ